MCLRDPQVTPRPQKLTPRPAKVDPRGRGGSEGCGLEGEIAAAYASIEPAVDHRADFAETLGSQQSSDQGVLDDFALGVAAAEADDLGEERGKPIRRATRPSVDEQRQR